MKKTEKVPFLFEILFDDPGIPRSPPIFDDFFLFFCFVCLFVTKERGGGGEVYKSEKAEISLSSFILDVEGGYWGGAVFFLEF